MDLDAKPVEVGIDVLADVGFDAGEDLAIARADHVEFLAPRIEVEGKKLDVERGRDRFSHLSVSSIGHLWKSAAIY